MQNNYSGYKFSQLRALKFKTMFSNIFLKVKPQINIKIIDVFFISYAIVY